MGKSITENEKIVPKIRVTRSWLDWRIAEVDIDNLRAFHLDDISGGIRTKAPKEGRA
jgi:hypothetical protein